MSAEGPAPPAVAPEEGKYQLVRRIAVGGMAEIFLARVTGVAGFEKPVVLKRVLPHLAAETEFVEMFLHEARLAAMLNHPNIAQVYDIGQSGDTYFFTMEYVHGDTLRSLLREASGRDERLELDVALTIASRIASGLQFAHERRGYDGAPLNIVHRDVSLSNVLIGHEGSVKVVDFGIAKAVTSEPTNSGWLKGKFAYMSPEQARGQPLDRRSDIFSLGILLFEMTTGTRLFDGDNEMALLSQVTDDSKPIPTPSSRCPDYPAALEAIVMRALARDREARYQTAEALAADLEEAALAARLSLSERAVQRVMRRYFGEPDSPLADTGEQDGHDVWERWASASGPVQLPTGSRSGRSASASRSIPGSISSVAKRANLTPSVSRPRVVRPTRPLSQALSPEDAFDETAEATKIDGSEPTALAGLDPSFEPTIPADDLDEPTTAYEPDDDEPPDGLPTQLQGRGSSAVAAPMPDPATAVPNAAVPEPIGAAATAAVARPAQPGLDAVRDLLDALRSLDAARSLDALRKLPAVTWLVAALSLVTTVLLIAVLVRGGAAEQGEAHTRSPVAEETEDPTARSRGDSPADAPIVSEPYGPPATTEPAGAIDAGTAANVELDAGVNERATSGPPDADVARARQRAQRLERERRRRARIRERRRREQAEKEARERADRNINSPLFPQ